MELVGGALGCMGEVEGAVSGGGHRVLRHAARSRYNGVHGAPVHTSASLASSRSNDRWSRLRVVSLMAWSS